MQVKIPKHLKSKADMHHKQLLFFFLTLIISKHLLMLETSIVSIKQTWFLGLRETSMEVL